jgi:hypothetical protein
VVAHISTGKDVRHIQGTIGFHPTRSMILERISVYLNVREEVIEGNRSNAKTHTHNIFTDKVDDDTSGKPISKGWFETSFLLEFPDNLPPTFSEHDNKIIWEVKFEVIPRNWPSWKSKRVIKVHRLKTKYDKILGRDSI